MHIQPGAEVVDGEEEVGISEISVEFHLIVVRTDNRIVEFNLSGKVARNGPSQSGQVENDFDVLSSAWTATHLRQSHIALCVVD